MCGHHREVKFFSLLQRASLRSEKRMCERQEGAEGDNFFALIEKGRSEVLDESSVWGAQGPD